MSVSEALVQSVVCAKFDALKSVEDYYDRLFEFATGCPNDTFSALIRDVFSAFEEVTGVPLYVEYVDEDELHRSAYRGNVMRHAGRIIEVFHDMDRYKDFFNKHGIPRIERVIYEA
jgi:hypothetical protein